MQALESQLRDRYPQWFAGPRAGLGRALLRGFGRWSRLTEIEDFLGRHAGLRDFDFLDAAVAHLGLEYRIDTADLGAIPVSGRLLIVANHPAGALDALALLHAVGRVRRDVKIVANDLLMQLEPMSGLLLPVRVLGGCAGAHSLRAIEAALEAEACVIVFPAGEVSRLGLRGVRDGRWRPGFVRFARRTGAPVLPVRIVARNSPLFYGASAVYRPIGTILLAREMFASRRRPLRLHVGQPLRIDADDDPKRALRQVRSAVYRLGRAQTAGRGPQPLAPPVEHPALVMAIAQTELLGRTDDGKEIRLARLDEDSPLLREIGRLRELTFREVGEGTGKPLDLDEFDPCYEHILVWDAAAGRIAGAYRVMRGAQALARRGLAGLYTASLFRYSDEALPRIAQGLELGRSFVVPDYWGSRSLDYLWQGIGAYLRRHPRVRYLFGAVSISAALPQAAREQLVAYYSRYHGVDGGGVDGGGADSGEGGALAASLRPFRYFAAPPDFGGMDAETAFRVLKANLAAHGATVPVLYKQYTELCEPGGARFLAFGVDPAFSDSIDGLIEVDLQRVQPRKRRRYLQANEATA
jgi:putative hemolysin